ncbi:MAG TPA: hypothetical protein VFQ06_11685, partial [Nitrospira sp.]|nr:hypothetical protein [Nitrospira sp.]
SSRERLERPRMCRLLAVPGLGEARLLRGREILDRVGHAERTGDLLLDQGRPRLAIDRLEDDAKDAEAEVRVGGRAGRLPVELRGGQILVACLG